MKDKFYIWLSYKLPRRLVLFCAIRMGAETTSGIFGATIVPEVPFMVCLERWDRKGYTQATFSPPKEPK